MILGVNVHALYAPVLRHFRNRRMKLFMERFRITAQTTVLDMGGSVFNWMLLPIRPRITILNISNPEDGPEWAHYVVADGCNTGLSSGSFDVVFSNSVIEHVGGIERQRQFAAECMRCGRGFFVQTPNRWFPVDTHTLAPFIHWFPQRIFRRLVRFSPRLVLFKSSRRELEDFRNLRLLARRDLQELFPGAQIIQERFWGIPKSLIAVSSLPSEDRKNGDAQSEKAAGTGT